MAAIDDYLARFSVPPDSAFESAYRRMFNAPGFPALMSKFDAFYILCGADKQSSMLNVCDNTAMVESGTVTHVPRYGFRASGNSNYLDTGKQATALTKYIRDDAGIVIHATATTAAEHVVGVVAGAGNVAFTLGSTSVSARINDLTSSLWAHSGARTGLYVLNRTSSTAKTVHKDGVEIINASVSSDAVNSGTFRLFNWQTSYAANNSSTIAFFGVGQSLDSNDRLLLQTLIDTFLWDVKPYRFVVLGSGQSNMSYQGSHASVHSGNNTVGTDAWNRILKPAIQDYLDTNADKPYTINYTNYTLTAFAGSSVTDLGAGGSNAWWDYDNKVPFTCFSTWKSSVNALGSLSNVDQVIIPWAQGEAEVGTGSPTANFNTWYDATKELWAEMRAHLASRGFTGTAKIVIQPLGPNSASNQVRLTMFRNAQYDLAEEVENVVMAPSTLSYDRLGSNDWHCKGYGFPNGYDKMAEDLALTMLPLMYQLSEVGTPVQMSDDGQLVSTLVYSLIENLTNG